MKTQISTETKKYVRFFRIVSIILCLCGAFMRTPTEARIGQILGYMIGSAFAYYIFFFCLASCITIFIKNKDKSKKVSITLIALFSLIFLIKGFFS